MTEEHRAESRTSHPLIEKVLASRPAVAELIGFKVEEISGGRAVAYLQAGPQHANPMGTMHGGVLCDLADAAMGMAFASTLARNESFTTTSLSINFFRPVWQPRLRAEAHVVSRGRTWVMSNVMSPIRMASRSQKQAVAASSCEANTQNSADRGIPLLLQFPKICDPTRDDSISSSGIHSAE
jgi:uncharacterized protein (TIGR00369 family)